MQCSTFSECCSTPMEKFWIEDPRFLFCTLNPYPKGSVMSTRRLNAMTRLIIYISLIMYCCKYKYWYLFLALSLLFIILLYYSTNNNNNMTSSKEYFDIIDDSITTKDYLQSPLSLYTNTRSDMTSNITNNLKGASENLVHKQSLNPSTAKRDSQAGIQYYTPHLGTNPRVNVPPIIGPRIYDSQVWGKSSTVFPNMNFSKTIDMT